MNNETNFNDLIDAYTDTFGSAPGVGTIPELETLHARHPAVTRARLKEAGDAYTAGRIHSPWGFVLTELRRHDHQRASVPQDTDRERETAVRLAERYVRTASVYLPTEPELLDDLFGPHGRLKPWADDHQLQDRFADLWREQRPRGQQAEQEQQDRATRWRQAHDRALEPDDQDWT